MTDITLDLTFSKNVPKWCTSLFKRAEGGACIQPRLSPAISMAREYVYACRSLVPISLHLFLTVAYSRSIVS